MRCSCYAPSVKRPSIAIVGPGRLGTALAVSLKVSGYSIAEIIVRRERKSSAAARVLARKVGARVAHAENARFDAEVIWFSLPDSKIATAAREFTEREWKGKVALHSSGVLTSDALAHLRDRGAKAASVHPLMTFVPGSAPDLFGVTFAAEGDASAIRVGRAIVRDLGGELVLLRKQDKVAYHAFATMVCPLLVALLASAERVASLSGIGRKQVRRRMLPIIEQTLRNYKELGPEKAFTGPFVRGDLETIRLHLKALGRLPTVRDAYAALAIAGMEYLPSRNRRGVELLLRRRK